MSLNIVIIAMLKSLSYALTALFFSGPNAVEFRTSGEDTLSWLLVFVFLSWVWAPGITVSEARLTAGTCFCSLFFCCCFPLWILVRCGCCGVPGRESFCRSAVSQ